MRNSRKSVYTRLYKLFKKRISSLLGNPLLWYMPKEKESLLLHKYRPIMFI
ncbi:LuxR family transcriptional regulator [Listeria marthii FSL S4-120]|uniref:LuxR family transcriptional regulator n=1 Tax=Listeria marthii FSL S4-120 TaxID=702457 RepID=A0ABP2JXK4_9LIST|nr:LuxR family transcriptional regulator [Listeria marthii FSL S4-120]